MNHCKSFAMALMCVMLTIPAAAQQEPPVTIVKLTDHIYKISEFDDYEVNFVASVGEDGILLIDTGFKVHAQELKKELDALGAGPVRYVINTHAHVDHTGGNALFGKQATVIGYEQIRKKFDEGSYILEEYSDDAYPVITFKDSISLYFNGEEVKVIALPGSHSDSDTIVIFPKSKVAYLGDLAYGNKFPSYSLFAGSAAKYAEIVRKAMEFLPDDTAVVSGHGNNCSMAQMGEYLQMLDETTNLVKEGLEQGKDITTLQKEKIFSKWEEKGYGDLYVSANDWITGLANSINPEQHVKKSPVRQFYDAFKEGGIEGLKKEYSDLKTNYSGEYQLNDSVIYVFGNYILKKGFIDEATEYYKFMSKEYPEAVYLVFGLGEAYLAADQKDLAVKCFRRMLEMDPGNMYAIDKLEQYDPTYNKD